MATDLADELVRRNVPFREAHHLVGQAVALAAGSGKSLQALGRDEYLGLSPAFDFDVQAVLDPQRSISQRNIDGGTGPHAVRQQIEMAKALLAEKKG